MDQLQTKGCSSVVKKAVDAAAKIDAKRKLPKGQQTAKLFKEEGRRRPRRVPRRPLARRRRSPRS